MDLSKHMDAEVAAAAVATAYLEDGDVASQLYSACAQHLLSSTGADDVHSSRPLKRIVIQGLAPRPGDLADSSWVRQLLIAVHALRGLVRSTRSIAFISVCASMLPSYALSQLHHSADTVFRLKTQPEEDSGMSFTGATRDVSSSLAYMHIFKMTSMNTLAPPVRAASVYVMKRYRKHLALEQLHLPPADASSSEPGPQAKSASSMLCAPVPGSSKLDF
eukprot:jgi/Chlat1/5947/Chrsp4S06264